MLVLAITCQLMTTDCNAKLNLKKIKSFFKKDNPEKIDQKEIPATAVESIAINNINGPITIKTGWKKNSLFLKTTKRAKKEHDLSNIDVTVDTSKNNHLTIATHHINPKIVGSVEYELIIPTNLDVALTISGTGAVCIKDVQGNIQVVANDNITITNSHKAVNVTAHKKGSIAIVNALGPIEARSHAGNISGEHIAHNFNAHSKTGKVSVAYRILPSTSSTNLETISGNIMLALPADTNAEIRGHTTHGTLMSDHYITLRSYATQLNNMAWNKFKKEVDGTIGSGEAAIALHSAKGNIKIIETRHS
jgi:hypothetical protein